MEDGPPPPSAAAGGGAYGARAEASIWETLRMAWSDLPGIQALIDLLCPPRCVFCGADEVDARRGGAPSCDACARALSRDGPRCPSCGVPLPGGGACGGCRGRCPDWDGLAVLAAYGEEVREAVLRAKRPAGESVAAGLAALLVRKHERMFAGWGIDVVVPVPMHWLRRTARGTSSADVLARRVAAVLHLPCRRVLRRCRPTRMQNELPFDERAANVRGVFRAIRPAGGRRVLLIDDVTTTGATLAECRRALVEAGAAAVYAGVVARADRGHGAESDI
jgi:ComF family protein